MAGVHDRLAGGFPYSEGIFEDLNKVIFAQCYWNSNQPVEATLKEYIAYECSPDVLDDVLKVIGTLENNHHLRWWPGLLEGVKLTWDAFPNRGLKPRADPGAGRRLCDRQSRRCEAAGLRRAAPGDGGSFTSVQCLTAN